MLKCFTYAFILLGISSLVSCKKDNNDPNGIPEEVIPVYLLKTIEWNNGVRSAFTYNTDSTLKEVTSSFQSAASKTIYNWSGSKMIGVYQEESLFKNVYNYRDDGKLCFIMNTVKYGTSPTAYTLEFFYQPGGRLLLDSMKYFRINEAGKHLQTVSRYSYNTGGNVVQITTEGDGYSIIHTIDEWSPKLSFDALAYVSTTLDEHYAVYNYAVLSQSNKLPAKIYRVLKEDNKEPETERIEENVYTLTGYRIDKVKTTLTFPGIPANNRTVEAVYSYN